MDDSDGKAQPHEAGRAQGDEPDAVVRVHQTPDAVEIEVQPEADDEDVQVIITEPANDDQPLEVHVIETKRQLLPHKEETEEVHEELAVSGKSASGAEANGDYAPYVEGKTHVAERSEGCTSPAKSTDNGEKYTPDPPVVPDKLCCACCCIVL